MHTLITEIRDKQNITKEQLQLLLGTDDQEMIEELWHVPERKRRRYMEIKSICVD